MKTLNALPQRDAIATQHPAIRKLRRVAHLIRATSAVYAAAVLWNILNWWLDADRVKQYFGDFVQRDLSAVAASQRYGALTLDLVAWALLLIAVFHCWRFMSYLGHPALWSSTAARHVSLCAWFAVSCEVFTLFSRPVQSFLLTAHLSPAEHVWQWRFQSVDLLVVLFCLSLLMFAYAFTWTLEVAEENRSFV